MIQLWNRLYKKGHKKNIFRMESKDSKCHCDQLHCHVYFYGLNHAFGWYLQKNRCYTGITESVQLGTKNARTCHVTCQWFVETDELGFKIRHLNRPQTKRGILSAICSLYDLRGFAALETITASTGHLEDKVELGSSFGRGHPRQLRAWSISCHPGSASHTTLLLPTQNGWLQV